jgi:gamma-glutamyl:cysteine ligase YbdK (ATP-grasp superfamily)
MGQEIDSARFTPGDFQRFSACLQRETVLLETWFRDRRFAADPSIAGLELEAWLVDERGVPQAINEAFLERLGNPLVVPELSVFNVELNIPERPLQGSALSQMHDDLAALWAECNRRAAEFDAALAMIGILPTVREQDLTLASMSNRARYRALNEQVLRLRGGRPLRLDIRAAEALRTEHTDLMLEAATTSFQLHLQVRQQEAAAFFNAALLLSAPLVAATANSPYLFGKDLWAETRIPLFEQAVAVSGDRAGSNPAYRRVTFGHAYVRDSLLEIFQENLLHYPPLLPVCTGDSPESLSHVRLHNGTIWRWNRPLIGFDKTGAPHLRIEHRVIPAGPTLADTFANAALFYGLIHALARPSAAPRLSLPFARSRENFYTAAREGLHGEVLWLGGRRGSLQRLLLDELIPLAHQGLRDLTVAPADIATYLGIITARVASGRTGASWQRAFTARHGRDMQALTAAYLERQRRDLPVHEWTV